MSKFARVLACTAIALTCAAPAAAAVVSAGSAGFTVTETAHLTQPPNKVYAALIAPRLWWSSAHSFSGSAANYTLDAKAGGCWCETLPDGGSAQHMMVVYAQPGHLLRLRGALGPLQGMGVIGAMSWSLKAAGEDTDLTLTYTVGGYVDGGFATLSKAVDGVLAEQARRLTLYVDTGMPEAP